MRARDCRGPGTASRRQGIPGLGRGQTLGIDVEAAEATSSSRSTNWTRVLRGPRYVDAPFRVLLLLIAVVGLTPASIEAPDPLYWAFQVLAAILLVAVCFTPVIAGSVGLILFVVFVLTYPDRGDLDGMEGARRRTHPRQERETVALNHYAHPGPNRNQNHASHALHDVKSASYDRRNPRSDTVSDLGFVMSGVVRDYSRRLPLLRPEWASGQSRAPSQQEPCQALSFAKH